MQSDSGRTQTGLPRIYVSNEMIANHKNIIVNNNERERKPRKRSCKLGENENKVETLQISISFEFDAYKTDFSVQLSDLSHADSKKSKENAGTCAEHEKRTKIEDATTSGSY
jgi:hypothetical protein